MQSDHIWFLTTETCTIYCWSHIVIPYLWDWTILGLKNEDAIEILVKNQNLEGY